MPSFSKWIARKYLRTTRPSLSGLLPFFIASHFMLPQNICAALLRPPGSPDVQKSRERKTFQGDHLVALLSVTPHRQLLLIANRIPLWFPAFGDSLPRPGRR